MPKSPLNDVQPAQPLNRVWPRMGPKIGLFWGLNRPLLGPLLARTCSGADPVERHLKGIWAYYLPEGLKRGSKRGPKIGLF